MARTTWPTVEAKRVDLDAASLEQAAAYAGGSGMVVRFGRVVLTWGDTSSVHHIQSATKSIGVTGLGLAADDGGIDLEHLAIAQHPELGVPPTRNAESGWLGRITIRHLADMTAGFGKDGGYTELMYPPGSAWAYSDGGANWLGECVTLAYRQDLAQLFAVRVFRPIGIRPEDLTWRDNIYRPDRIAGVKRREIGAGIFANAEALARIGLLYLQQGQWEGKQIVPARFVDLVGRTSSGAANLPVVNDPLERFAGAAKHYGLLWWNNGDGSIPGVPPDTYWAWGLGDALIVVMPSLGMVVSRVGEPFPGDRKPSYYRVLTPFLRPIAAAAEA